MGKMLGKNSSFEPSSCSARAHRIIYRALAQSTQSARSTALLAHSISAALAAIEKGGIES